MTICYNWLTAPGENSGLFVILGSEFDISWLQLWLIFILGGKYLYRYTLKRLKDFQEKEAAELLASARWELNLLLHVMMYVIVNILFHSKYSQCPPWKLISTVSWMQTLSYKEYNECKNWGKVRNQNFTSILMNQNDTLYFYCHSVFESIY